MTSGNAAAGTAAGPTILLIEDEPQVTRFLRATLPAHGYRFVSAETGKAGLVAASVERPDLILLDLGLPDVDGLEVTRSLREWTQTPIVVLSARGQEKDKVQALDAGADDYLTKPIGVAELLARMRDALRHAATRQDSGEPTFVQGDLRVDMGARRVFLGAQEVRLTRIEYRLLTTLVRYAGKVVTHRQLLKEVWGPEAVSESHYLRVYMAQLRKKLEADPAQPRYLLTETGVGYRLAAD
jgi:two-component system KDP operon response regulator KdpE